ncbi:Mis12 domain-containing protein [Trichoderma ceciliae]
MAASSSDYELLTEHFSYPPVSLLDDIINTVNVLADRAFDSVERLLLSIPPHKLGFASKKHKQSSSGSNQNPSLAPEEAAKLEIENGTHQLETLLNASIDKNFDIFELYVMQNIITVRPQDQPYMRLSHYHGLDFSAATGNDDDDDEDNKNNDDDNDEDNDAAAARRRRRQQQQIDKPTPESITALRRRLQASQTLNAVLEAEKARNEALLRRLRSLLDVDGDATKTEYETNQSGGGDDAATMTATASPFTFLRDRGGLEESGGRQPITTTTEFTLSQLQPLRSLSGSLRRLLPALALPGDASASTSASASWRRERAEYVESSSRKYLETVAGLELGPGGEVRDGEWQGEGRGLSKGEVEGLERMAAVFGGGKDPAGTGEDAMDTT